MGLFTPKWQHEDPQKRLEWIEKANPEKHKHQEILIEIAKKEKVLEIQFEAVKKLTNPEILADIAKNDDKYSIRKFAY